MRSRSKPSSVKRLRRLLTIPLIRLVIFILLIVLDILGWLNFKSPALIAIISVSTSSLLLLSFVFCFSNNFFAWTKNCFFFSIYIILYNENNKIYLWLISRGVTRAQFWSSLFLQTNMEGCYWCWDMFWDFIIQPAACRSPAGKAYTH